MSGVPRLQGVAVSRSRRNANDMDRTRRMAHNRLGDASQEQPVEPPTSMRPHHDDVGFPRARRIDNRVPRIRIRCRHAGMEFP